MEITKEEAIAEAKRRGLKIPGMESNSYGITREEAIAEARRRGLRIPGEEQEAPWLSGVRGFNTKFDRVFHGLLQPLLESGALGENISQASKGAASERERLIRRSERENPYATKTGEFLGEVAMDLPAYAAGAGIAGKVAPKLSPYLKNIVGGAIGLGGKGGSEYANEEESRLVNALSGAGQGAAFGALPLAGRALKEGAAYAKNIPAALNTNKLVEKLVSDKNAMKSLYKKGYNEFFNEAEKAGVTHIAKPKIKSKYILKNSTKNESEAFKEFLSDPTIKNAHRAQSDLGKVIRRLDRINETSGLKTPQIRALEAAKDAQKRIRGSMFQGLEKAKQPALAKKYAELTEGYKKEVLPYTRNKPLNEFGRGELTQSDLLSGLLKNKQFKAQLLEKYPELSVRGTLPKTFAGVAGTGTALYGINKLYDLLSPH